MQRIGGFAAGMDSVFTVSGSVTFTHTIAPEPCGFAACIAFATPTPG